MGVENDVKIIKTILFMIRHIYTGQETKQNKTKPKRTPYLFFVHMALHGFKLFLGQADVRPLVRSLSNLNIWARFG